MYRSGIIRKTPEQIESVRGTPAAESYYLGKVLECASFCAEPYGGKETVLGEITHEDVRVTALHPGQLPAADHPDSWYACKLCHDLGD